MNPNNILFIIWNLSIMAEFCDINTLSPSIWCFNYYKESFVCEYIPIMVCRNICERIYSKIQVGEANYSVGKKYCRRCEIYLYHNGIFCPCCGMQLRTTPTTKKGKERLRK
jgi:hypothetical protein